MALRRRRRPTTTTTTAGTPGNGEPAVGGGLGRGAEITVKGAKATAEQRATAEGILREAARLGASRRVMVACIMAATQESTIRPLGYGDQAGPDSRGPFQQRAPWGPLAQRVDPAGATRLFLTVNKGPGVQGWRVVHGSLQNAPADLSRAIQAVQHSATPDAYAQWEAEATRTVAAFTGADGLSFDAAGSSAPERYEFTRGDRGGERESTWDATGRLAEEVAWRRWAAGNVFYFVSEDELRRAAPSLTVRGTEDYLVTGPAWRMSAGEPVAEITVDVMLDAWPVMPGASVTLKTGGPIDGRWLVAGVSGARIDSPVATVTLRRPTLKAPEPANPSTGSGDSSADSTGTATASGIFEACKAIHDAAPTYLYGGGHGTIQREIPGALDCSSSTSYALAFAGYGFKVGDATKVSGALEQWGQPGRGDVFTVCANATHVFIQLEGKPGGFTRFDTSPHGDTAGRGPRLRTTERGDLDRFTLRHWPGQ